MTNAWLWLEKSKATVPAEFLRKRSVWNPNFNSAAHKINATYFLCIFKNWTWARDRLKTNNLLVNNFKKILDLMISGSGLKVND